MARDRFQNGWVEEIGKKAKKWRGHYFVYVKASDDSVTRKHRVVTLGLKSELRKGEAEKKLRQIIERATGTVTARPDENVSFRWFWENRFLPLQVGWRDSTRAAVLYTLNRHVLPAFGDTPLARLTRFDLQGHLNRLAAKYSKSLVDKVRTWVRSVLEEAVEQEYLVKNPARKLSMPPTRATCKRFLTKAEYHKLLGVLEERDQLILRLFVLCALRPGELFALRWKCLDEGHLEIDEAVYRGKLGEPKTKGSAAKVALPKSLAADLIAWHKVNDCPGSDQFIFPSRAGKPIDSHNYLRRDVLRPAAESVGIKGVTFQCLRRTFATHFHGIGTVKDQQSQMRHTNAQTTMNIYTQALSGSLQESMEDFDEEMSRSTATKTSKGFEHK
ncbi:MAG: integrase family protein [Bryobacterales bacterium]|nr:integrase family protein [Bryobacterales bacterium]